MNINFPTRCVWHGAENKQDDSSGHVTDVNKGNKEEGEASFIKWRYQGYLRRRGIKNFVFRLVS